MLQLLVSILSSRGSSNSECACIHLNAVTRLQSSVGRLPISLPQSAQLQRLPAGQKLASPLRA